MSKNEIKNRIMELIKQYYSSEEEVPFVPGKTRIPLVVPSFDWQEVTEALDSLLTGQVTMGEKVQQFESMYAEYIGTKYATMVTSGSTANLMALSILTNPEYSNKLQPEDEVITPALTWATTVYPIINCNLKPVFVDVQMDTFNIDPEEIRKAITPKTKAIMPVHLLGNPCNMDEIMKIAREHNLLVIEDTCEAHGAEFKGKKAGSFGDLGTFSFFFSHHLSTIEGGMLVTDNEEIAELSKALRVFGWIRNLKDRERIAKKHEDIDPRFLFVNIGSNFRPTELQGAFGIHQVKKLDYFIDVRRENVAYWSDHLDEYKDKLFLHKEQRDTKHVWFAYPVTVKPDAPFTRKQLVEFLEEKGVETRPIMSGNFVEQPVMKYFPYRKIGDLPNAHYIMENSFFFGNHPGIKQEERESIVNYFDEFFSISC